MEFATEFIGIDFFERKEMVEYYHLLCKRAVEAECVAFIYKQMARLEWSPGLGRELLRVSLWFDQPQPVKILIEEGISPAHHGLFFWDFDYYDVGLRIDKMLETCDSKKITLETAFFQALCLPGECEYIERWKSAHPSSEWDRQFQKLQIKTLQLFISSIANEKLSVFRYLMNTDLDGDIIENWDFFFVVAKYGKHRFVPYLVRCYELYGNRSPQKTFRDHMTTMLSYRSWSVMIRLSEWAHIPFPHDQVQGTDYHGFMMFLTCFLKHEIMPPEFPELVSLPLFECQLGLIVCSYAW